MAEETMSSQMPKLKTVIDRMERLESALEMMGQALKSRTVEAEKFILVDRKESSHAQLTVLPDGQLQFVFQDRMA